MFLSELWKRLRKYGITAITLVTAIAGVIGIGQTSSLNVPIALVAGLSGSVGLVVFILFDIAYTAWRPVAPVSVRSCKPDPVGPNVAILYIDPTSQLAPGMLVDIRYDEGQNTRSLGLGLVSASGGTSSLRASFQHMTPGADTVIQQIWSDQKLCDRLRIESTIYPEHSLTITATQRSAPALATTESVERAASQSEAPTLPEKSLVKIQQNDHGDDNHSVEAEHRTDWIHSIQEKKDFDGARLLFEQAIEAGEFEVPREEAESAFHGLCLTSGHLPARTRLEELSTSANAQASATANVFIGDLAPQIEQEGHFKMHLSRLVYRHSSETVLQWGLPGVCPT